LTFVRRAPARFGCPFNCRQGSVPADRFYFFIPEDDLARAQFHGCELVEQNT